jgi:hypothetical protein
MQLHSRNPYAAAPAHAWWDIIVVIENIRGEAKRRVIGLKTAWDIRIGAYNLSAVHM